MVRESGPRTRNFAPINSLFELAESKAPGPSPSFSRAHVLLVFLNIGGSSFIARKNLAIQSGLGEGAVRTVLKKLKQQGYVDVIKSGCFLSRKGRLLSKSIGSYVSKIESIPRSELTMGECQVALKLKRAGSRVGSGIEQRDSAIRVGASGATTFIFRSGKFAIPGGSSNCETDFPSPVWSVLKRNLKPRNNDVILLCGAKKEVYARLGALAAMATLV